MVRKSMNRMLHYRRYLFEVKDKVKEEVGKLTSNPKLETEGKSEKSVGKVKNILGK